MRSTIGIAKAIVLPVGAFARMSRPARASLRTFAWIGTGRESGEGDDARGYAKLGKGLLHSIHSYVCCWVEIRLPRPLKGGTEEVKPHGTTAPSVPAG